MLFYVTAHARSNLLCKKHQENCMPPRRLAHCLPQLHLPCNTCHLGVQCLYQLLWRSACPSKHVLHHYQDCLILYHDQHGDAGAHNVLLTAGSQALLCAEVPATNKLQCTLIYMPTSNDGFVTIQFTRVSHRLTNMQCVD